MKCTLKNFLTFKFVINLQITNFLIAKFTYKGIVDKKKKRKCYIFLLHTLLMSFLISFLQGEFTKIKDTFIYYFSKKKNLITQN